MVLAPREVISVDVPVDFDTAWAYVRDPRLIRRWWGWDRASLDEDIVQMFLDDAVVQRADCGLPLGWLRWHNHDRLEVRGGWGDVPRTTITLRRPERALLASFDGLRDEVDEGWITWLHQLKFALSRHLGEDRHALAIHELDAERPDRALYRAGLHGARGVPVGGAVEIRRPDGTVTGGSLEFCERHQFGLWLRGLGGSLLVVQLVPPGSHPPSGALNAIWSLWGLDDDELDAARQRWTGWWRVPTRAQRGRTAGRAVTPAAAATSPSRRQVGIPVRR
jgi:hypothetical protein